MKKPQRLNFEKLIKNGENPEGIVVQTPNGTAKDQGTGWNRQWAWDARPEVSPEGPWAPGSNRTGG